MASCQNRNSSVLFLVSALFVLGWGFPTSPVLAGSGKAQPSSDSSVCGPSRNEAGKTIVKAEDLIKALAKEGDEIDCSGRIIEGQLNLFEIPAEKDKDPVTGKPVVIIKIRRHVNFRNTEFRGTISTRNQDPSKQSNDQPRVKFLSVVDFGGARFQNHVNLDGAIFDQDAEFGDAQFHKMASFTKSTFQQRANFRSVQFDERALFRKVTFNNEADFAIARFNWLAFFMETKFLYRDPRLDPDLPEKWGANFLYTSFAADTIFTGAHFRAIARFIGTSFQGPTHFSECIFEDQVWFTGGAHFDNNITFKNAKFNKNGPIEQIHHEDKEKLPRAPVLFSGVIFSGDAVFSNAQFHHVAFSEVGTGTDIGRDTTFQRRADFRGTSFQTLDLRRVLFQAEADFSGADLGETVDFTGVDITRATLQLDWKQLLKADGEPKVYWLGAFGNKASSRSEQSHNDFIRFLSFLERNFKQREQLDDAGEVHYFMEDLKRKESSGMVYIRNTIFYKGIYGYVVKPWYQVWSVILFILNMIFYKGIYGYGVKPLHQVWSAILFITGFAFVYTRQNVLRYKPAKERQFACG